MSDLHIDHTDFDRKLFIEHIERIKKENGAILIAGDIFDATQTRDDPRRSVGGIPHKHASPDYIDSILNEAISLFSKYAHLVKFISRGNHELSILKHTSTDLIGRLAKHFDWQFGDYRGSLIVETAFGKLNIHYAHSSGTNSAPVTRGVIDVSRQIAWAEADVVWNAHIHTAYIFPSVRIGAKRRITWAIRTPSYLKSKISSNQFEAIKGLMPQPRGCVRIAIDKSGITPTLVVEP